MKTIHLKNAMWATFKFSQQITNLLKLEGNHEIKMFVKT
jgi:hypothetical protein